jgi:CRP-like cAMP-binding protein
MGSQRFGEKKSSGEIEIKIDLTHKDVADLAGLTREATSLQIGKLRKDKLISNSGKRFTIIDEEKLRETARIYHKGEAVPYSF